MAGGLIEHKESESGQSMIIVALALVVMLIFVAFAIDIGYASHEKSILQNAADSAALAGAMSIPESSDDQVRQKVKEFADINMKEEYSIEGIIIDRSHNTVQVFLSMEIDKFFSGIISSEKDSISTKAKAKVWAGEALPFINLDDNYQVGESITLWDKLAFGDFERLKVEYMSKDNQVCLVEYDEGVIFDEGVVSNIKPFIEYTFNQGRDVYAFSLRNDLIKRPVDKISNKHLFPEEDLVLLRLKIIDVVLNGNKRSVKVEVLEVISDFADVLPNAKAYGESKAILIE